MTRCRNRASSRQCSRTLGIVLTLHRYSGGYCSRVPPLPIPNREVKPACADGTAMQCGRVGSRHFYLKALNPKRFRALSFCIIVSMTCFLFDKIHINVDCVNRMKMLPLHTQKQKAVCIQILSRNIIVLCHDTPVIRQPTISVLFPKQTISLW